VRLVKRRKRHEPFQASHHVVVDQYRPVVVRTAMNNPMPHRHWGDAKLVPQPYARGSHGRRNVRDSFDWIGAVRDGLAACATRSQAWAAPYAIDLPLDLRPKAPLSVRGIDLELDA
jgi:hypothetical protein